MKRYRIVSDGVRFKVQRRRSIEFLWFKWETWWDASRCYTTHGAAQVAREDLEGRAKEWHRWREVK